jgi:hypothetical protein
MAVARTKGRLRGKQPKPSPRQEAHLVEPYHAGAHTIGELEELFPLTRSTIDRAVAPLGRRNVGAEELMTGHAAPGSTCPTAAGSTPTSASLARRPTSLRPSPSTRSRKQPDSSGC